MSLCCPVSVKRHHEGPALVIVIFCRLVLAFGANRFRGEKYHRFSVVMLYSHVFPADLTVMYTVWFNFVLKFPYIVKLRVDVGQIVVFLRTTRGVRRKNKGFFPLVFCWLTRLMPHLGGGKRKYWYKKFSKGKPDVNRNYTVCHENWRLNCNETPPFQLKLWTV